MKRVSSQQLGPRAHDFPWGAVLDRLARHYEIGNWRVPYLNVASRDPIRVLVSTILSQRTRDEVTYPVAEELFRHYPDVQALAGAPLPKLERLIHRIGFYQAKAKAIHGVAVEIRDQYGGEVPRELERLLELPMVGHKTANCVLVYAFDEPAIPVDTHVHRISRLFGVTRTRTPEETEEVLQALVPRDLWKAINPILVQHGQNICWPTRPKCSICPVEEWCATGLREKARALKRPKRA